MSELVERLLREGPAVGPGDRVRIRARGPLSGEALRQAYEMLVPKTALEGSALEVEPSPDRMTCGACGAPDAIGAEDLAGHVAICPACGAPSPLPELRIAVLGVSRA
jgi:hypothetical protein